MPDPIAPVRAGVEPADEDPVTIQARKRADELIELADDPNWLGI